MCRQWRNVFGMICRFDSSRVSFVCAVVVCIMSLTCNVFLQTDLNWNIKYLYERQRSQRAAETIRMSLLIYTWDRRKQWKRKYQEKSYHVSLLLGRLVLQPTIKMFVNVASQSEQQQQPNNEHASYSYYHYCSCQENFKCFLMFFFVSLISLRCRAYLENWWMSNIKKCYFLFTVGWCRTSGTTQRWWLWSLPRSWIILSRTIGRTRRTTLKVRMIFVCFDWK